MSDFLLVTGDAWVDHPSFGAAVIAAVLTSEGFSVRILSQPDWQSAEPFRACGRPRLGCLVTAGNIDSMVAHYTAAKKRRQKDSYSPGGRTGLRPDRASIVYSGRLREAFPGVCVILGGLEASLRRFAHYDYWDDTVRRSLLLDAKADILVYGMGERAMREIAHRLAAGKPLSGIRGTCIAAAEPPGGTWVSVPSFEDVRADKRLYAEATMLEYREHDPIRGRTLVQKHGNRYLICTPPAKPLTTAELDEVAEYPYTRLPDPSYSEPIPSIEEVRFSLIHNRGCFGSCHFCSLAFHQGRMISTRSHQSLLHEAEELIKLPDFKGYIHDVGGPTANFRHNACKKQAQRGSCADRSCLTPKPCPALNTSQEDYLTLLRKLRVLPGVKKVFVRSGIRFDYLLTDGNKVLLDELIAHHISGQLKVAPEHCVDTVLEYMGKPSFDVFRKFSLLYAEKNRNAGKKQFLVPYLISSHPGATLQDAISLAETLHRMNRRPEQVQDFYPTPGTLSTCMYYTGLDPRTMLPLYVARTAEEKSMQRALMQWFLPQNRALVLSALKKSGRTDLIGYGKRCLIAPSGSGLNRQNKQRRS